jgi:hypothetical protein
MNSDSKEGDGHMHVTACPLQSLLNCPMESMPYLPGRFTNLPESAPGSAREHYAGLKMLLGAPCCPGRYIYIYPGYVYKPARDGAHHFQLLVHLAAGVVPLLCAFHAVNSTSYAVNAVNNAITDQKSRMCEALPFPIPQA